ncbi:tetratricopeptide repeat protein [Tundrisphaera sp. TA3]|uniref:tetratricopeptide repeat protein n=1 Tax=Tundrisphaera sp. TA3 TaxID=3435775 RepID=UPI003EBCDEFF
MPPRREPRPSPSRRDRRGPAPAARRSRVKVLAGVVAVVVGLVGGLIAWPRVRPPTAEARMAEARALLAADRVAEADRALGRALELDPANAEAWRLRLEILRVEDRTVEALQLGRLALKRVASEDRGGLLRSATAAAFAEIPDDQARDRLARRIAADPDDVDARVALWNRMAAMPRAGDAGRDERIAGLTAILDRDPGRAFARASLAEALADAGEVDRVRDLLDAWPEPDRDARYDRIRGRWDLDHDRRPDRAADAFRRAVGAMPHDWKAHYGLARALRALGQEAEARREAEAVARLRELLDPSTLGPRLASGLRSPGDPRAAADLADLCDRAGLHDLADAWRGESAPAPGIGNRSPR